MHPILWQFYGIRLPSFGIMLALGFLTALWLGVKRAPRFCRTADEMLTWAPILMLGGLLGAKLLYLAYFPLQFMTDPVGVLLYPGGLVWYGGVLGALGVIGLWCAQRNVSFLTLGDWLAPGALAGLALGRIGCFLSGCCYGAPCALPWAIQYPLGHATHPTWVHPTPLYEATLALLLMGFILWLERRFPFWAQRAGAASSVFLIGYGIIRFGLEGLRGDALHVGGMAISASQWISLAALALGVWLLSRTKTEQPFSHAV